MGIASGKKSGPGVKVGEMWDLRHGDSEPDRRGGRFQDLDEANGRFAVPTSWSDVNILNINRGVQDKEPGITQTSLRDTSSLFPAPMRCSHCETLSLHNEESAAKLRCPCRHASDPVGWESRIV